MFEFESFEIQRYQSAPVINYPNDYDFTRISEYKYLTQQIHHNTSISKEYPNSNGDPYYPIPNTNNFKTYKKYYEKAQEEKNTIFLGRLAEYKYYNMDNVVMNAINLTNDLLRDKKNCLM